MNALRITPVSGKAYSFYYVSFHIDIPDYHDEYSVSFTNHLGHLLPIVLSSTGTVNGNFLTVHGGQEVTGYLSIFENDILNTTLADQPCIKITAECFPRGKPEERSEIGEATFINEMNSIDGCMLPFDVVLDRDDCLLDADTVIRMIFTSTSPGRFEVCLRSSIDSVDIFVIFFVLLRQGITEIALPLEILKGFIDKPGEYNCDLMVSSRPNATSSNWAMSSINIIHKIKIVKKSNTTNNVFSMPTSDPTGSEIILDRHTAMRRQSDIMNRYIRGTAPPRAVTIDRILRAINDDLSVIYLKKKDINVGLLRLLSKPREMPILNDPAIMPNPDCPGCRKKIEKTGA